MNDSNRNGICLILFIVFFATAILTAKMIAHPSTSTHSKDDAVLVQLKRIADAEDRQAKSLNSIDKWLWEEDESKMRNVNFSLFGINGNSSLISPLNLDAIDN